MLLTNTVSQRHLGDIDSAMNEQPMFISTVQNEIVSACLSLILAKNYLTDFTKKRAYIPRRSTSDSKFFTVIGGQPFLQRSDNKVLEFVSFS